LYQNLQGSIPRTHGGEISKPKSGPCIESITDTLPVFSKSERIYIEIKYRRWTKIHQEQKSTSFLYRTKKQKSGKKGRITKWKCEYR
jgi:hypothetical protein